MLIVLLFLFANSITIQDYFAYPKYELQFTSQNITTIGSIEISSNLATCFIPKEGLDDKVVVDEPDVGKAIEKIAQMPCLYQISLSIL